MGAGTGASGEGGAIAVNRSTEAEAETEAETEALRPLLWSETGEDGESPGGVALPLKRARVAPAGAAFVKSAEPYGRPSSSSSSEVAEATETLRVPSSRPSS